MVLKMPPTRIGRHEISAPNSFASGWMLWKARYVQGLEQSKKNSIITFPLPRFAALVVYTVIASEAKQSTSHKARTGLLRRFAPRNDGCFLRLSGHLLCGLSEHILARLLVERLLHEFADRQPGLHLRPRAHFRIPALDVRIIVERKALRFVGHGPGKAGDVGNRIVAGDVSPGLAQLRIEHAVEPGRLVAIAFDGVGDFLRRIERKMPVLAEHGTKPTHLPHHPLHHPGSRAHLLGKKAPGLVGQIN